MLPVFFYRLCISLFKLSLSFSIFLLSSLNILITMVLNSVFHKLLAFILFIVFLWEFLLFFHLGNVFLSSHFCCLSILFLCIRSPGLGRVALCSRCPMGLNGTVSSLPELGAPRMFLVTRVSSPVVVES